MDTHRLSKDRAVNPSDLGLYISSTENPSLRCGPSPNSQFGITQSRLQYGNLVYRPGRPFPFASAVRDNGSIALTPQEGHSSMVRLPIVRLYLHPFFTAARSSSC